MVVDVISCGNIVFFNHLLLSFAPEVPLVLYLFLLIFLVWLWAGLHMGYRSLWMLILYVIFNCLLVSSWTYLFACMLICLYIHLQFFSCSFIQLFNQIDPSTASCIEKCAVLQFSFFRVHCTGYTDLLFITSLLNLTISVVIIFTLST